MCKVVNERNHGDGILSYQKIDEKADICNFKYNTGYHTTNGNDIEFESDLDDFDLYCSIIDKYYHTDLVECIDILSNHDFYML